MKYSTSVSRMADHEICLDGAALLDLKLVNDHVSPCVNGLQ